MAEYKKICIHCGTLIEGSSRFCPQCGSRSPFGYHCPSCLHPIQKGQQVCAGCGRTLYITCPFCGEQTFVDEKCEKCNRSLMVKCDNRRCGEQQFFQNTKCTSCGKKIKAVLHGK
ncbi:MAG: zinc-ribbon domain-containing protein [Hespellia sp.]|nr:zinc-ribbon domain-containing protein [Hespellia sp.]